MFRIRAFSGLGLIYDDGLTGTLNRRRAVFWYERSASKGYGSAQLNLGIIVANRRGPRRDLGRAVRLYCQAARQGRRNAAYNLGLYYSEGRGVRKSLAKARRWYAVAADLGDRDSRRILKTLGRTPNNALQRTVSRGTPLAQISRGRKGPHGGAQGARHAARR